MLTLKGINKTFNKGTVTEKPALLGVDLHLDRGDFVTVIGGNGAGKSTMLNSIAGVFPVDAGTITLDGNDVTRLSEPQRARYLEENLALAARRGKRRGLRVGITREEREEYREKLSILGLGLETRLADKVGLLSGGQRQALTLLMASLNSPDLLLLDEHTAALDPKTAAKVLELTQKIVTENGLTTLMVTHNMHDAIRLGNRLIMMSDGKIIYEVSGEEKAKLHRADLMAKFEEAAGAELASDRMLLG